MTIVRVSPSGALDATFGANGIVTTPFNTSFSGNQSQAFAGFLQSDGKIVAAAPGACARDPDRGSAIGFGHDPRRRPGARRRVSTLLFLDKIKFGTLVIFRY